MTWSGSWTARTKEGKKNKKTACERIANTGDAGLSGIACKIGPDIDHPSFSFLSGSSFGVGKFLEELMLFPLANSNPIRTRRGIVMIVP